MLGNLAQRIGSIPLFALLCFAPALFGQTVLTADGVTPAYTQFTNVLGAMPENPDCSHPAFGPHITQVTDDILGVPVFDFNIHVTPDNDRCINFDRQRLEAKVDTTSPAALKGGPGSTMTYQWMFRLPAGFQPSSHFTHIHQIKGGLAPAASGAPVITLTPRFGSPNTIQLIYQTGAVLAQTDLAPFLNVWVVATEVVTIDPNSSTPGKYSITIKTLSGGATLFSYSNSSISMFPAGAGFLRPKWGIYRSLLAKSELRDEQIHFNNFCVAMMPAVCPSSTKPDFSLTATPTSQIVPAGSSTSFGISVTPTGGFNSSVSLSVAGLPSGATGAFTADPIAAGSGSSTLNVSTPTGTSSGNYPLVITATGGGITHTQNVTLSVTDFSLSITPASQTVKAGSATTYTVTVAAANGFAGTVALSATGVPSGATATFNPASVTAGQSSTLTIEVAATEASSTSSVVVHGASGSLTHTAPAVTLIVQAVVPDFTLAVSAEQTVVSGKPATYTVTVGSVNGFASAVALRVSGLPANATAAFVPASITASGSSTLTVSTTSATPAGAFTLTIEGATSGLTHSVQQTLTVTPSTCSTIPDTGTWSNSTMTTETGTFTATFDATPSVSPISAAVGLSKGAQTAFTGFANLVVFTTDGAIQARNGGAYAAASTIPYKANVTYSFRLVVNVTAHTYSIYVTPAGGSELTVGTNYAFRTEQTTVTSLTSWGALVNPTPAGSLSVCSFAVK